MERIDQTVRYPFKWLTFKSSNMKNAKKILKNTWEEIVFENRNKAYGAYALRRLYDEHMTKGFLYGSLIFTLFINTPNILNWLNKSDSETNIKEREIPVILENDPRIHIPPPPAPPPPPPIDNTSVAVAKENPVPLKVVSETEPIKEPIDFNTAASNTPDNPNIDNGAGEGLKDIGDPGNNGEGTQSAPPVDEPEGDKPFTFVTEMPSFPDGEKALMEFLRKYIIYPNFAKENGIEGTVILNFIVGKDGSIENIKVIRSAHSVMSEEAIRVAKKMPRWKPGKNNGKVVPVSFILPITFRLE